MPGYNATAIPKPARDVDFEQKCVVLFRELLEDPNVKRVGRRGQSQDGVDVVGHRNRDAHQLVGVQCKVKEEGKKLTETEVRGEVRKALKYKPKLIEYIIVTTAKNDTKIQQLSQGLAQEQAKKGRKIIIDVWGWADLPLNFHPAAVRASADVLWGRTLDRWRVEFSGSVTMAGWLRHRDSAT